MIYIPSQTSFVLNLGIFLLCLVVVVVVVMEVVAPHLSLM